MNLRGWESLGRPRHYGAQVVCFGLRCRVLVDGYGKGGGGGTSQELWV